MTKKSNQLRIIAGKWRGRKIQFPDIPHLRPTPDRVRETLFNWLASDIHGARCLDLFAGSGALGFEALSRGAAHVVMIDESPKVIQQIKKNLAVLDTDNAEVIQASIPNLQLVPQQFDIIFLDPPFQQNLIPLCCEWLVENKLLKDDAFIYIETEASLKELPIPDSWEIIRSKQAGQVKYYLVHVTSQ